VEYRQKKFISLNNSAQGNRSLCYRPVHWRGMCDPSVTVLNSYQSYVTVRNPNLIQDCIYINMYIGIYIYVYIHILNNINFWAENKRLSWKELCALADTNILKQNNKLEVILDLFLESAHFWSIWTHYVTKSRSPICELWAGMGNIVFPYPTVHFASPAHKCHLDDEPITYVTSSDILQLLVPCQVKAMDWISEQPSVDTRQG